MFQKKIINLLFVFCLTCYSSIAQLSANRIKQGTITKVAKFKPPVVKTFLGRNSGTDTVLVEEANQLVNLPLKIIDDKSNAYIVTSYQFMYKKKSVIENEQTGRKETVFTTVSDLFKINPLPEIWRTNIGGSLQKDEELYYFDIIVKDKLNRKFFAPELKIKTK
jgi:hypothetical protein